MKLPVGTRIRFIRTLDAPADDHSPSTLFAEKGELGTVTGHSCFEGHMIKTDKWPNSFGAVIDDEFVVEEQGP